MLYSFDLFIESESCAAVAPDGVAVTFRDKVVSEAEILKDEETDDETMDEGAAKRLPGNTCVGRSLLR
jgi:hypothetical protein